MKMQTPTDNKQEELLAQYANARLGELITIVIGNNELQNRFENNPTFQKEEFNNAASGNIAVLLKIISPNVKTSLLTLQAACRSVAIAREMQDKKPFNDDIFKFVGSDKDPEILKEAQASWMLSNLIEHDDCSKACFSHNAVKLIRQALFTLENEGYKNAVGHLQILATYLQPNTQVETTPHDYACKLREEYKQRKHDEKDKKTDPYLECIEKLARLTEKQKPNQTSEPSATRPKMKP